MSSNKQARKELEIWKDIKDYEGYYQVSNFGKIKSLDRIVKDKGKERYQHLKEKEIHSTDNGRGYQIVSLRKDDKRKNKYVHRLVAEAFIPNPNNLSEVNHKNLNKKDNTVDNLEWCTNVENKRHYLKTDTGKSNILKRQEKVNKKYQERIRKATPQIIYLYKEKNKTIAEINKIVKIYKGKIGQILKENGIIPKSHKINKICRMNEQNDILEVYDNYKQLYDFIKSNNLSNAKYDTIRSEIYDAITLRRKTNIRYGYRWKKVL